MNDDSNGEWWNWPCQNSTLEYKAAEIPKRDTNSMLDDTKTPLKACVDLPYHVISKDFCGKDEEEEVEPPYPHVKRRRVLHFEPELLDPPPSHDDIFLRTKEKMDCIENEFTDWVSGFAESSNDELPDPSSEGWISSCFNDNDLQISAQDLRIAEYDAENVAEKQLPVHTHQNVIFKGRKSYMHSPPRKAASSSVIYPFTFIKPCGAHGDVTLEDINQRLVSRKPDGRDGGDPSVSLPTSAFSGKPVVGKTKISTEGGEGSITIVRTRG